MLSESYFKTVQLPGGRKECSPPSSESVTWACSKIERILGAGSNRMEWRTEPKTVEARTWYAAREEAMRLFGCGPSDVDIMQVRVDAVAATWREGSTRETASTTEQCRTNGDKKEKPDYREKACQKRAKEGKKPAYGAAFSRASTETKTKKRG